MDVEPSSQRLAQEGRRRSPGTMDAMNTAAAAGTRLRCTSCGTEVVVVKPATGPLACCGRPMSNLADGTGS
jgi:desulfoferrodoxin-like iron-binding protein